VELLYLTLTTIPVPAVWAIMPTMLAMRMVADGQRKIGIGKVACGSSVRIVYMDITRNCHLASKVYLFLS